MMMPPNNSSAPPPPAGAAPPPPQGGPAGPGDGSGQGAPGLTPADLTTLATGISPEARDVLLKLAPNLVAVFDIISQGSEATDNGDGSIAPPQPQGASSGGPPGGRPSFAPGRPAQPTSRLGSIQG